MLNGMSFGIIIQMLISHLKEMELMTVQVMMVEEMVVLVAMVTRTPNKYEERNCFPCGETIAHDRRYEATI